MFRALGSQAKVPENSSKIKNTGQFVKLIGPRWIFLPRTNEKVHHVLEGVPYPLNALWAVVVAAPCCGATGRQWEPEQVTPKWHRLWAWWHYSWSVQFHGQCISCVLQSDLMCSVVENSVAGVVSSGFAGFVQPTFDHKQWINCWRAVSQLLARYQEPKFAELMRSWFTDLESYAYCSTTANLGSGA